MTVKELIERLKKLPQDSTVAITDNNYINIGAYEITSVDVYDSETVEISIDWAN